MSAHADFRSPTELDPDEATRPCWMEIDLGALAHNYREIRARIGPDPHIIAALKANAYGHGAGPVAACLESLGAHTLATGSLRDAVEIRDAGVDLPIMMFGGTLPQGMPRLLAHGLTPTVYDDDGVRAVAAAAAIGGLGDAPVYVKVDAGLGRLGVPLPDAFDFVTHVSRLEHVRLEGVYTHLSFFDAAGREWSRRRVGAFDRLLEALDAAGIEVPISQVLASSTLLAGIQSRANAICPGHLLYGVSSVAPEVASAAGFRPVLAAVRARLIHVGALKDGMRDGGRDAPSRVGVLPLGLADGYRAVMPGTGACVLVRGRRAAVVGVSLEHMTLDLTGIDAAVGDPVTVLGDDGDQRIGLEDVARWQGSRAHHVLMAFDGRLPRRLR